MRRQWPGGLLLLACSAAGAGDLKVDITDQHGRPVAAAVVSAWMQGDQALGAAPRHAAPATRTINQVALTFVPYIEVFRPGDKVVFRNSDKTRHHVYSFSTVKAFEFMLSPGESSLPLELDEPGVVAVGCNIHDAMITYLYVSDAPWISLSNAAGNVSFDDLPPGTYAVRVWQPRLRPGKPDLLQSNVSVDASEDSSLSFTLSLLPDSRLKSRPEHRRY